MEHQAGSVVMTIAAERYLIQLIAIVYGPTQLARLGSHACDLPVQVFRPQVLIIIPWS